MVEMLVNFATTYSQVRIQEFGKLVGWREGETMAKYRGGKGKKIKERK